MEECNATIHPKRFIIIKIVKSVIFQSKRSYPIISKKYLDNLIVRNVIIIDQRLYEKNVIRRTDKCFLNYFNK